MRINVYAEELPTERRTERVTKRAAGGLTYFGARLYLISPSVLHDIAGDDDRSAITFWGPKRVVARLLRELAGKMDGTMYDADDDEETEGGRPLLRCDECRHVDHWVCGECQHVMGEQPAGNFDV